MQSAGAGSVEALYLYPPEKTLFRAGIAESSTGPLYALFIDITRHLSFISAIAKVRQLLALMMNRENLSLVYWLQQDVHLEIKLFRVCSRFPSM